MDNNLHNKPIALEVGDEQGVPAGQSPLAQNAPDASTEMKSSPFYQNSDGGKRTTVRISVPQVRR